MARFQLIFKPQLTLFDLGPDGWILYWKKGDQAPQRPRHHVEGIIQLPLFDLPLIEQAVGAEEGNNARRPRSHPYPIKKPMWQEIEE